MEHKEKQLLMTVFAEHKQYCPWAIAIAIKMLLLPRHLPEALLCVIVMQQVIDVIVLYFGTVNEIL